ncbi:MAG: TetR/AcrR family transcriptional regulator [Pseudomonadota bacterium]
MSVASRKSISAKVVRKTAAARSAVRRTQEQRSAAMQLELIDAAVASIAQLGLAPSTLAAIAARAGFSSGAVQHHFRTRDELLLAVVDAFGKSLADDSQSGAPDESIAARVHRIFGRYWTLFTSPQYLAVLRIWLGTRPDAPVFREILDHMQAFEMRFDREWVELFADCPATPETIINARHIAFGAMRGLSLRLRHAVDRSRADREAALLEAMLVQTLSGVTGVPATKPSRGVKKPALKRA